VAGSTAARVATPAADQLIDDVVDEPVLLIFDSQLSTLLMHSSKIFTSPHLFSRFLQIVEYMAPDSNGAKVDGVDCSASHVHDYALLMLRSAAAESRALPPGDLLPIGVFLDRERQNKHINQQIFNKVCSSALLSSEQDSLVSCVCSRPFSMHARSRGLSCTARRSGRVAR
jgi:hypothetical protein